jgi:hypothetical protein
MSLTSREQGRKVLGGRAPLLEVAHRVLDWAAGRKARNRPLQLDPRSPGDPWARLGQKVRSTARQATAWCVKVATISSWRTGLVASYVRIAHQSAPRVTLAMKGPSPSG